MVFSWICYLIRTNYVLHLREVDANTWEHDGGHYHN